MKNAFLEVKLYMLELRTWHQRNCSSSPWHACQKRQKVKPFWDTRVWIQHPSCIKGSSEHHSIKDAVQACLSVLALGQFVPMGYHVLSWYQHAID